jgi:hypothetical protein
MLSFSYGQPIAPVRLRPEDINAHPARLEGKYLPHLTVYEGYARSVAQTCRRRMHQPRNCNYSSQLFHSAKIVKESRYLCLAYKCIYVILLLNDGRIEIRGTTRVNNSHRNIRIKMLDPDVIMRQKSFSDGR